MKILVWASWIGAPTTPVLDDLPPKMHSDQSNRGGVMKVKVRITGRVQGVAYRAWTRATAVRMNLTGWVRNEPDGAVLALICGPETKVTAMMEALWKGPPAAMVDNVEVSDAETAEDMREFRIIR